MGLDPRTKLLILAITSVSVFLNRSIAVECAYAGIPLLMLAMSGQPKKAVRYGLFFVLLLAVQLCAVPHLPVAAGGIVYMFAVYIRKLLLHAGKLSDLHNAREHVFGCSREASAA